VTIPAGHTAVMAQKRPRLSDGKPWQDRELFPTPPWATRALMEEGLNIGPGMLSQTCWEPCAGLGHMSDVLREYFPHVTASDVEIYDNAPGYMQTCDAKSPAAVEQFAGNGFDWIITNPPFGIAEQMLPHFLRHARHGVALLLRLQWLQGKERFDHIFLDTPPAQCLVFTDRVGMCEGGYDPKLSTATAYAWFVWERCKLSGEWLTPFDFVIGDVFKTYLNVRVLRPGLKKKYFRDSDNMLAARHVPGFVSPRVLKAQDKAQLRLDATP
jgi:hypothetical protein